MISPSTEGIENALYTLQRIRPLFLRFSPGIESGFEHEFRGERISYFYKSLLVGIAIYNSFLLLDWVFSSERLGICLAVRLGISLFELLVGVALIQYGSHAVCEVWFAFCPLPFYAGVLYLYRGTPETMAWAQAALILMMMYKVSAMRTRFVYACAEALACCLGDLCYLAINTNFNAPRIALFGSLVCVAAYVSSKGIYEIERQERIAYLMTVRNERQNRELAAANAHLARLSSIDALTGIPNRRSLDAYLWSTWEQCVQKEWPLSTLMIDLDHFKVINDKHGHAYGDIVLCSVACAIRDSLREDQDMVGRYGGEEFLVILPNRPLDSALLIAQRICDSVRAVQLPLGKDGMEVHVTVSVGAATDLPLMTARPANLLRSADVALYMAKEAGRDRVSPWFTVPVV